MKWLGLILILGMPLASLAQKKKVNYKYKKYERFDFDALDIEGAKSSPGDLSIAPRFNPKFRNKIPERKNFNKEMKSAIDSIL